MLLAIDIGNTATTSGIFNNSDILISKFSFQTEIKRKTDQVLSLYDSFFKSNNIPKSNVDFVYIASVVPEVNDTFVKTFKNFLGIKAKFVDHLNKTEISLDYINPEELGADRLCNSIAGFEKYGGPVLIIDMGTAVTYDLISEKYEFLGGLISPGIELSLWALTEKTSRLLKAELVFPETLISTTTEGNIQSGLFFGQLFEIKGVINYIRKNLFNEFKVVITGGFSELFYEKLAEMEVVYDKDLTLEGIKFVYKYKER